jgi:hypothetical protein
MVRLRLFLAAVLLLTSCGPSVPTGAGPVTPTASPSTSRGVSPTPSPAVSMLANCRLPVSAGNPVQVGWLDVSDGTFRPDLTSVGHVSPINYMVAWDPAITGWVPTDPESLSPDGARYVAPITSATIDIVDARTGSTIAAIPTRSLSDDYVFVVIGYTPTAVYLVTTGKNPQPGVWKIDTSSWALSQVTSKSRGIVWALVDGSVVWGDSGFGGIERLDSSTGVVQEVRAPGQILLAVAGLAGSGVLVLNADGTFSWAELVNSDGSSQPVEIPPAINGSLLLGPSLQYGPESLFASSVGLVAYDQNRGFQLFASRSDLYRILGGCATG